jgi:hypothetical protein
MLERLTLGVFAQHLNSQFQIAGAQPVELVEANQLPAPAVYEAFSLIFRGPASNPLPQATYRLHHDALGDFDLFMVPVRQDQHGRYYEAVFNRRRAEAE